MTNNIRLKIIIGLLLGVITLQIYSPVQHFGILYYDDPSFVSSPEVAGGLNWHSLARSMTGVVVANWHPVTNLSFLLTHEVWGYNPGAEHSVNVYFHTANVILLFLVLLHLTGATWRSAIVAAIFAWHPLRVESVAWIAERKDVLFVFFMLLSLLCYAHYARPTAENPSSKREVYIIPPFRPRTWYLLALVFFVLSFMSKATVVTLPFVLLLLDLWPLKRFQQTGPSPHRDPAQDSTPNDSPSPLPSPAGRGRMAHPIAGLIVEKIPFFALTILFCGLTFWVHKTHGDVQTVEQFGLATRLENATLNYIFYLGKFFWPAKLSVFYPYPDHFDTMQVVFAGLLVLAISALCVLEIPRRPYLAVGWFWYLGTMIPVIGLVQIGEQEMADRHTYISLIGPAISVVWMVSEWAGTHIFRKWTAVSTATVILVGCAVLCQEELMFWQNSVTLFERAIAVTRDNSFAEFSLGKGLEMQGLNGQAAVHYRIATALKPQDTRADVDFSAMLLRLGYYREAVSHLERIARIDPTSALAMNNLAWTLATCPDATVRNGAQAVQWAGRACELTHYQETAYVSTLAAAYAEAGRYDDAVTTAQKSIALAEQHGETDFLEENQNLLQIYATHQPYHEPSAK